MPDRLPVINLDHNATTVIDPRVAQVSYEAATKLVGNPSSQHALGRAARTAVEHARQQVAAAFNANPRGIIFTGGATEADNLALLGTWAANQAAGRPRGTVIVGATEHPAVLEPAQVLVGRGARVVEAPVHADGRIDVGVLAELINDDTLLVSIMLANNETGVINPLSEIVKLAKKHGSLVHTDATQAPGRIGVDFRALGVDMMSTSAHKMHGPRGVGALVIDLGARVPDGVSLLEPLSYGGGQERELRPGTYNTAGIVGFGAAAGVLPEYLDQAASMARRREDLATSLTARIPGLTLNGATAPRLPNTLSVRVADIDGEALLANMPGLACSTGSACSSGTPHPSHVLVAMGMSTAEASECIRLSLCTATTDLEIKDTVDIVADAAARLRSLTLADKS